MMERYKITDKHPGYKAGLIATKIDGSYLCELVDEEGIFIINFNEADIKQLLFKEHIEEIDTLEYTKTDLNNNFIKGEASMHSRILLSLGQLMIVDPENQVVSKKDLRALYKDIEEAISSMDDTTKLKDVK